MKRVIARCGIDSERCDVRMAAADNGQELHERIPDIKSTTNVHKTRTTMKHTLLAVAMAATIACSCTRKPTATDGIMTFTPLEYERTSEENIADIIDKVRVVDFEATQSSLLSNVKKVLMTANGDFIIQDNNGVMQFSNQGKFIRRYGNKGRADNEYISLESICIGSSGSTVYLLDAMNKVLCYDIETGKFTGSFKLNTDSRFRIDDIVPSDDGGIYILSCNDTMQHDEEGTNTVYRFTADGEFVEASMPVKDHMIMMYLSTQSFGNSYILRPFDDSSTAYKTSPDGLQPYCRIDFKELNCPTATLYGSTGEVDYEQYFCSKYYKFASKFVETPDCMTFLCVGPDSRSVLAVADKRSEKGYMIESPDDGLPFYAEVSDEEYIYFLMNYYSLDGLDYADPLTRYLVKMSGVADADGNPKMIGIKFRF